MKKKAFPKPLILTIISILLIAAIALASFGVFPSAFAKKVQFSPYAPGFGSGYAQTPSPLPAVQVYCNDSDANESYSTGLNYYKQGIAISKSNGATYWYNDTCLLKNRTGTFSWQYVKVPECSGTYCNLQEGYCTSSGVSNIAFSCPIGCRNGACITSSCTDSDNGFNYTTKGYVYGTYPNGSQYNFSDYCAGNRVVENYCGSVYPEVYNGNVCENGCGDGVCRTEEEKFIPDNLVFRLPMYLERPYLNGDRFTALIIYNATKYPFVGTSDMLIYYNDTLIDSVNLDCMFNPYFNTVSCVNWGHEVRNFISGNRSYNIKVIGTLPDGKNLSVTENIMLNFWVPEVDTKLCLPLIEEHINISANRKNLVFAGRMFDKEAIMKKNLQLCGSNGARYCNSNGYSSNGMQLYNPSPEGFNLNCSIWKNGTMESTVTLWTTWQEVNCSYINTSFEIFFPKVINGILGLDNSTFGLFKVEPFIGSEDKFNFWYINKSEGPGTCDSEELSPSEFSVCIGEDKMFTEPLLANCNLTNKIDILLINQIAGAMSSSNMILISSQISSRSTPYINEVDKKAFLHEFGHSFGSLNDEYVTMSRTYPGSSSYNCFKAGSKDECLQNAPWRYLINENSKVGCYEGCFQYAYGVYRSSNRSIMAEHQYAISYDPWNIKVLNETLNLIE